MLSPDIPASLAVPARGLLEPYNLSISARIPKNSGRKFYRNPVLYSCQNERLATCAVVRASSACFC
jgi:hypothetical protein